MGSLMAVMLEIHFCAGDCALPLRYSSKQKCWWQPCCNVSGFQVCSGEDFQKEQKIREISEFMQGLKDALSNKRITFPSARRIFLGGIQYLQNGGLSGFWSCLDLKILPL